MAAVNVNDNVRYEPDENPPPLVTIGSGIQAAILILAPVVLTVVIVSRIAGQSEGFMTWAIFAALLVSGSTTVLQAVRVGRFGSGHVLMMGTSGAFIAVCVAALKFGGPETMASLIVISSLFQFLLAARLSWLRRIFTPIVTGTVIMLIAATVMPIIFDSLNDVPEGSPQAAAPVAALVTMVIVTAMVVRSPPAWRLWSPIIAIAAGCLVSIPFGIFDFQPLIDAPWIGIPFDGWPGFNVAPGVEFWALLPAFIVVTLVGAIETIGDGVAIQRVSRRNPRATDFRVVQGALNADGVGNLLSGLLATVPNTTYSSSISLAEVTGVAARRIGVVIGVIFVALAFFPKVAALLIAIPAPVAAAYITVLVVLLFVQGMRIVINDGMDHRKAMVVGLSFWIGAGFQSGWIFADLLGEGFLGVLLSNGMTAGAIVAIIVMVFIELTRPRRRRLQVALESDALPKIEQFLLAFAGKRAWNDAATERLTSAGEETLAILLQESGKDEAADTARNLTINARMEGSSAELEFVTSLEGENVEDYLAHLNEMPPVPDEREVSFRLLWHYASSVRHQKYHGLDIITVQVEGSS
ncbi:MAG: purine/pyrimidine permease [Chloroflexi bacterium]|nr:purine/pyrimidine permease [Chloroflexota bacterium]